ncbi:MAG: hypothetical protein KDC98_16365 [Planctomycetes bacterium]|nr:hypothetical protein [Planctomycetota bacterium]
MAKKRTPQTFEKRARERDKQMKREAKQADRLARSAAKRDGKPGQTGAPVWIVTETGDVIDPKNPPPKPAAEGE